MHVLLSMWIKLCLKRLIAFWCHKQAGIMCNYDEDVPMEICIISAKDTCEVAKHVPCLHGCVEEEEVNNAKAKWSSRQNTVTHNEILKWWIEFLE